MPLIEWGRAIPAPAKINLFLHVVGRRADGYHLLQTCFRFLDWGDHLIFEPRSDGVIELLTPLPGVDEQTELSVRAARRLQQAAGVRLGAAIHLDKRIPMGGGLGGGSSDAASTLIALNRLWRLDWPRPRLAELALALGADVPVFIFGRSALAEGVGEQLTAIELPPACYVIVFPGCGVPTGPVFADPELTRSTEAVKIGALSEAGQSVARELAMLGFGRNDLEPVVCRRYPEVGRALCWLRARTVARMSGSGACLVGWCRTPAEARALVAEVPAPWAAWVATGIDEHPLAGDRC